MFELTTAVVIVAPHDVQAIAIPIICQFSPDSLIRFRPHITLMFPFAPYDQLETSYDTLYNLGAEIAPFEVTLAGYGEFPGVIYMKPANPSPVKAAFEKLYNTFPEYPPYEGKFGDDLQPHMTVAHFDSAAEQSIAPLPRYQPITFCVERLHLWYGVRDTDLPWLTYNVIPLRG